MKNKAFSLAEVLITLVVIGVVAAIKIPTLMVNFQKEKTVIKLKKAYSTLYNVYNLSVSHNGPVDQWDFGKNTYDWNVSREFLNKYFVPYVKTARETTYKVGGKAPKQYILINGIEVDADVRETTADLILDLNGGKKPNRRGRDIFVIRLSKAPNYKPFGFAGAVYNRSGIINNTHGCKHSAAGNTYTYCGALIHADNWQIKDDYPW